MRFVLTFLLFLSKATFAYDLDPLFLIDGCVDIRTGEWVLEQDDAIYRSLKGKWQICPHTHLTLFGPDYTQARVCEKTGLALKYIQTRDGNYEVVIPKEVTNTCLGEIGAKTNLLNQTLIRPDKFTFVLITPDQTKRIYKKGYHEGDDLHFLLKEEHFANGTVRKYGYNRNHNLYTIDGERVQAPSATEFPKGLVKSHNGKTFTYQKGQTIVEDNTKTVYHLTSEKQLSLIQIFDQNDQLIEEIPYVYSEDGLLLQKGNHYYEYDERGNPISEQIGSTLLKREFDEEDRVTTLIETREGTFLTTNFAYTKTGLLSEAVIDDGTYQRVIEIEGGAEFPTAIFEKAEDTLIKTTRYQYGDDSIKEEIFDPDGTLCFSRMITPSHIHKPWLEIYPIGLSLENGYEVERDYFGRMVKKRLIDEGGEVLREEKWEYNAYHLLSTTDQHGLKTTYHYDDSGQKTKETLHTNQGLLTTSYQYDGKGRIKKKVCQSVATIFAYDKDDQIIEIREETLDGKLLTLNAPPSPRPNSLTISIPTHLEGIHVDKDCFGNIIKVKADDGTIDYTITYNTRNQPLEILDHITGKKGTRQYDDLGNLISETLLNGLTLECKRDLLGRRTTFTLPDQSVIHSLWGPKFLKEIHRISHRRKYDYVHQLIHYTPSGFPDFQQQISGLGNITYDVDQANILGIHSRFIDQKTATYNEEISSAPIDYSYELDSLGRIIEIKQPGRVITFSYDVWNRRMTKTVLEDKQDTRYDPIDLAFIYDDTLEIGAMSNYSKKLVELKVIPDTHINTGDQAIAYELANLLYLPQFDLLGNPHCLISVIRNKLMESYQFSSTGEGLILDIYGEPLESSKALNPWGFKGHRMDVETGLYYIDGAYFDPIREAYIP